MPNLKDFTILEARPLPVILLLDASGSMTGEKIQTMNKAVREMLTSLASEDSGVASIKVGVIRLGADVDWHQKLTTSSIAAKGWQDLEASGKTPLGGAITLLRNTIEDRDLIPSRAYRPTIILVSDGKPTDDWEPPMEALLASERASKATRFAMGIGPDADHAVLEKFIGGNQGQKVFEAHEATSIQKFFQFVTMTVTARTRSSDPDSIVPDSPEDYDDFDY